MLTDINKYAEIIYSLPQKYFVIQRLEASIYKISPNIGRVSGVINFKKEIELKFVERINFNTGRIYFYSYEIRQYDQILYFYDPQPHPNDPDLALTFPHHKHVAPDIKHNRKPASGLSFDKPNLPFLIQEISDQFL
ncbi:hypothetical protein H8E88_34245 [candidate division KSB1 bacterium]|nr:hypothetical protein [candidate division KSB1 bacterium]MBL7093855.1 hypothetical protein [candidate division KSB1 bacterium]